MAVRLSVLLRFRTLRALRRAGAAGVALGAALALAGCPPPSRPGPSGRRVEAHHSLEEIGEWAFADGERAEERHDWRAAFDAYARAEWAFEYHRRLTGREPELLVPARAACERLQARLAATRRGAPAGPPR